METIEITIDPVGRVKYGVQNGSGASCKDTTRAFDEMFLSKDAKQSDVELKPEFYNQEQTNLTVGY